MEIDWNTIWSAVTAISTLIMTIAAWQAKNSFIKQRGYEDYLKITELLDNCQNKILFLPWRSQKLRFLRIFKKAS